LVPPALEVRLGGPGRDHEVAGLPRRRPQQLESLETGLAVHRVLAGGEAGLELRSRTLGNLDGIDLDDGHVPSQTDRLLRHEARPSTWENAGSSSAGAPPDESRVAGQYGDWRPPGGGRRDRSEPPAAISARGTAPV